MENTSGFYKYGENQIWFYGYDSVEAPGYTLTKEEKDTYQYPVDGWNWYDEAPSGYLIQQNIKYN